MYTEKKAVLIIPIVPCKLDGFRNLWFGSFTRFDMVWKLIFLIYVTRMFICDIEPAFRRRKVEKSVWELSMLFFFIFFLCYGKHPFVIFVHVRPKF